MTVSPDDLLPVFDADDLKQVMLPFLQAPENPVTYWGEGGALRTMLELESHVQSDLSAATRGAFPQGMASTADGDSLTTVAHADWAVDRVTAAFPIQEVTLACDASHGPYAIAADRFFARATEGRPYVAATGGTLSSGGSLTIDARAVSAGAARGLVNALITPLPGVRVVSATIKVITGVPQVGADQEPDQKVKDRCAARLPDVDATPSVDRLIAWAKEAVDSTTRYRRDPDTVNPGGALFTVAGAGGAIPSGDVTTIADYIAIRLGITDYVTVQNASNVTVNTSGVVRVAAGKAAAVKAAADAAWKAYLASVEIGAVVFLTQLVKAVMDAGALNFTGYELNGVGDDLVMAATEVPVAGGTLAAQLTWEEV